MSIHDQIEETFTEMELRHARERWAFLEREKRKSFERGCRNRPHGANLPFLNGAEKMMSIATDVATKHGVSAEQMRAKGRGPDEVVTARFEAMYLIRKLGAEFSLPRIGRFFGGRDHTTVMNAIRRHEELTK